MKSGLALTFFLGLTVGVAAIVLSSLLWPESTALVQEERKRAMDAGVAEYRVDPLTGKAFFAYKKPIESKP